MWDLSISSNPWPKKLKVTIYNIKIPTLNEAQLNSHASGSLTDVCRHASSSQNHVGGRRHRVQPDSKNRYPPFSVTIQGGHPGPPLTIATCYSQRKTLSMNSSCEQHILQLRENKWKLSNRDILNLDPCSLLPWHFPVMWLWIIIGKGCMHQICKLFDEKITILHIWSETSLSLHS